MPGRYRRCRDRIERRTRILGLLSAMTVVAAAYLATTVTSTAKPMEYTLRSATATFVGGTDTLAGDFTYDPALINLDAVDIVITGPVFPTTVTTPLSAEVLLTGMTVLSTQASDTFNWVFDFSFPLAETSDPLAGVDINNVGLGSISVTGDAVPAAEPSSLTLLGGAFGLFLLTRRTNRHGTERARRLPWCGIGMVLLARRRDLSHVA